MRHDLAILTTFHPDLGNPGALVSIAQVQSAFETTTVANHAVSFKCADCGVQVYAAIPTRKKENKRNPSPYFAAGGTPHQPGCTREPVLKPTVEPASDVPQVWDDPRPRTPTGEGPSQRATSTDDATHAETTAAHEKHTRLISELASAWFAMTTEVRRATPLLAQWNKGGCYETAFIQLANCNPVLAEREGTRVFVGNIKRVGSGKRGMSIVLRELESTGEELRVWVPPATFTQGQPGKHLQSQMDFLAKNPSGQVFVLGRFQRREKDGKTWFSLVVTLPQNIFLKESVLENKKLPTDYDKHAQTWAERLRAGNNPAHRFLEKPAMFAKLPSLEGKRVLCIGCGSGEEVEMLKAKGAARIWGIDTSQELITIARKAHPDVTFEVRSMEDLQGYAAESFNYVYSSLTFHYVSTWEAILREIKRILVPGGILLFSTHHPVKWGSQVFRSPELDTFTMGYRRPKTGTPSVEGDYLGTRQITDVWFGSMSVQYYHRPMESMLRDLLQSGLRLTDMLEPVPIAETMEADRSFWTIHTRIPLFVIFELKKGAE